MTCVFVGEIRDAETAGIALQEADLLSVAVGAAFAAIYKAPALFAGRILQRLLGRHAFGFGIEFTARQDAEEIDGREEEYDAAQ